MSSNRLIYDNCAYKQKMTESTQPLHYVLNPLKYENCKKCRHELGLVGGTAVSHIQGNLVDVENDLRGATRINSNCNELKFQSNKNHNMLHLPSCQMINYKSNNIPKSKDLKFNNCK